MIRTQFVLLLVIFIVCSFCGKDFVKLGRHSWRCKEKVHHAKGEGHAENAAKQTPITTSRAMIITSRAVLKCCCGKICKGSRGLKMHQLSCRTLHGLHEEFYADLEEQCHMDSDNTEEVTEQSAKI